MFGIGRSRKPHLTASQVPPAVLPPGHGCLKAEFNRGPMPQPVPFWLAIGKFQLRVDHFRVNPVKGVQGTWYVTVPAGEHLVRVVDRRMGFTCASTRLTVAPGETYVRYFHFGGWRNQVYDGADQNVTRFGNLSVWAMIPVIFLVAAPALVGLRIGLAALLP